MNERTTLSPVEELLVSVGGLLFVFVVAILILAVAISGIARNMDRRQLRKNSERADSDIFKNVEEFRHDFN